MLRSMSANTKYAASLSSVLRSNSAFYEVLQQVKALTRLTAD